MAKKQKAEIITRADGSQVKIGGYLAGDKMVCKAAPQFKSSMKASKLPQKVDLRPYMTAVENQGSIGSCTANAAAGAYEYLINRKQGINNYDVSRLFLYYNSRVLAGEEDNDAGAINYNVITSLQKTGICDEQMWPYDTRKFKQKPPKECYQVAKENRIDKFEYVETDLEAWKSALAEGYPIFFGALVFSSISNPRHGVVPMPRRGDQELGGHAMLCVGYSEPDRVFIVRNSWGEQYGDRGYCYIPYDYLMDENLNSNDSWVIYDVNPISQVEETWSEDDESLFVDMFTEFDDMDDETWSALCNELGDYDITYRLGALYGMATVGDDEVSDEEYQAATDKLANILEMFGLNYDAEEVMEHCAELTTVEGFVQETVDILGRYLSPGALATIAKDMYEIASVDGLEPEEEQFIDELVGDWFNEELAEEYDNTYEERKEVSEKKSSNKPSVSSGKKSSGKGGKKSSGKSGSKTTGSGKLSKGGKKVKKGKKVRDEDGNIIYIDDDDDLYDDDDELDDDDLDLDDDDLDDEDFDDDDFDEDDEEDDDDFDEDEDDDDFDEDEDDEEDEDDDFDEDEDDEEDEDDDDFDEDDDDEEDEDDDDFDEEEDEEDFDDEEEEEEDEEDDEEEDDFDDEEEDYDGDDDEGDYDEGGDDDEDY